MKTHVNTKTFPNKKKWKPKSNKTKQLQPQNRKNKLHIKFDIEDRREYLTGFQKRKRERREKAHKQIEEDLKNEMKNIRKDRVQLIKKMIYNNQEMPESDNDDEEDNVENNNVTVTDCGSATVEISGIDLISSQHHIGTNQMGLGNAHPKMASTKSIVKEDSGNEDDDEIDKEKLDELGIHSQKDLYRSLKKSTFQVMKKSSLMKLKQARDAKKQKKAQARVNNHRRKLKNKKMKHKRTQLTEQVT
nr:nucleolar protein 12-like [Procambarus clarkii]